MTHVVADAFVAFVPPGTTASTQSDSTNPPTHTDIHHDNVMTITQTLVL